MLDRLPVEVLIDIFERLDITTVRDAVLICKQTLPVAQRILYRSVKLVCPRGFVDAKTTAFQTESTGLALLNHIECLDIPLYGDLNFDQHTLWLLRNVHLTSLTVRLKADGPAVKLFPNQLTEVVNTVHLKHLSLINDTRNLMLSTLFEWRPLLRKCSETLESLHCYKLSECQPDEPIMLGATSTTFAASGATSFQVRRPLVFSKLRTLSLYHIRSLRGVEFADSMWLEQLASIMPCLQTLKLGYVNIGLAKLFMRKAAHTIEVLHLEDETCEWLQRSSGETTSITVQLLQYLQGVPDLRLKTLHLQDLPPDAAKSMPCSVETLRVKRCPSASLDILCQAQQSARIRLNRVHIEQDISMSSDVLGHAHEGAPSSASPEAPPRFYTKESGGSILTTFVEESSLQKPYVKPIGTCSAFKIPVGVV